MGIAHFAVSLGGKDRVNALTEELRKNNFIVLSEPRTTGDGYYESVILDPEGNQVEITSQLVRKLVGALYELRWHYNNLPI